MLRVIPILLVTFACGVVVADEPLSDADQIKALIPAQTAMAQKEFEVIANSSSMPRERDNPNKTLTWVLFTLGPNQLTGVEEQFRYLTDTLPKPSEIAEEMYRTIGAGNFRILTAPVTMIQAERITKIAAKVEGDKATGMFAFKVPELYEGNADFVANRKDGSWRIDEFLLPKLKIHIVRDAKGVWSHKDAEKKSDDKSE